MRDLAAVIALIDHSLCFVHFHQPCYYSYGANQIRY